MKNWIGFLKLITGAVVVYPALYVFLNSSIFGWLNGYVRENVAALPAGNGPEVLLLTSITLIVIFGVAFGGERYASFMYFLALLLYEPVVLISFSEADWFKVFGFEIESQAPFLTTLLIGIVIIGGFVFFLTLSRIEEARDNLIGRGASEESASRAARIKTIYSMGLLCLAGVLTFSVFPLSEMIKSQLTVLLSSLPLPNIVAGAGGSIAISVAVALYFYNERKE